MDQKTGQEILTFANEYRAKGIGFDQIVVLLCDKGYDKARVEEILHYLKVKEQELLFQYGSDYDYYKSIVGYYVLIIIGILSFASFIYLGHLFYKILTMPGILRVGNEVRIVNKFASEKISVKLLIALIVLFLISIFSIPSSVRKIKDLRVLKSKVEKIK